MADFELSYGGKPFRLATADVAACIARLYPPEPGRDFLAPDPAGIGANTDLGERPFPPKTQPAGLNVLHYPSGATRWAHFRGLMTTEDKDAVLKAAVPADENNPLDFVMDDGTELKADPNDTDVKSPIETQLFMLPPRPVLGVDGAADLWLITLVDERYYWRWRFTDTSQMGWPMFGSGGSGSGGGGDLSWEPLFLQLEDDLDITLTYDDPPIDPAYLSPSPDSPLYGVRVNCAYALEAAAGSVGRVVCRNFDGTYKLVRHADATANAEDARRSARVAAGGELFPASPTDADTARAAAVPESVEVTFPKWVKDSDNYGHYFDPVDSPQASGNGWPKSAKVYSRPASGLGPPYSDWPTMPNVAAVVQTTCKAEYASGALIDPPTNDDQLSAAADQLAKDYYDACAAHLDEVYRGVVAFDPEGGCDLAVEWGPPGMITRVRRGPLNRHLVFSWLGHDAYKLFQCLVGIIEPANSGVTPPLDTLYDAQLDDYDLATDTFPRNRYVFARDANRPGT